MKRLTNVISISYAEMSEKVTLWLQCYLGRHDASVCASVEPDLYDRESFNTYLGTLQNDTDVARVTALYDLFDTVGYDCKDDINNDGTDIQLPCVVAEGVFRLALGLGEIEKIVPAADGLYLIMADVVPTEGGGAK